MKSLIFVALGACLLGCNTASTEKSGEEHAMTAPGEGAENYAFAYTIDHPADNWSPGNLKQVETVLRGLKAYETGDIDACAATFADSVQLEFDQFEAKLSNDSLKAMFANDRTKYKDFKVEMQDWESVISKDKTKEYVSLWYKQIWTDETGKTDSVEVMDDLLMKDGKIALLNEKIRHYPAKK